MRLDIYISTTQNITRAKAKNMIESGFVRVDSKEITKAGFELKDNSHVQIVNAFRFSSLGGDKLQKAFDDFKYDVKDKICVDIGASNGGFTDCMLQNGARKVYSVDVGHGQLDWKLRSDDRVVCMEKTNFRYMKPGDIEDMLSFASVDVSFISLTKILLPARELLEDRGQMVCLIKPQFEAGREKVGKKGVVKDPLVHREVIGKVMDFADFIGFEILHLDFSPVKGPEGNIEYLLHLEKSSGRALETVSVTEAEAEKELKNITEEKRGYSSSDEMRNIISRTVTLAHAELKAGDS